MEIEYNVKSIDVFQKQVKKLSKKYPSLKYDLLNIVHKLKKNPFLGTHIGKNCYKIRLAISSKGKGKSGGARIITHFFVSDHSVYLISIYDKSEKINISDIELKELIYDIEN